MRILTAFVTALLCTTAAQAEKRWEGGPRLGLGTPTGTFGAEVGYRVIPNLVLSAGLGVGQNKTPQASLTLRFRTAKVPLGIGAGLSAGGYEMSSKLIDMPFTPLPDRHSADVLGFASIEVFHDWAFDAVTLRFALGMQTVIAGTIDCQPGESDGCADSPSTRWPYFGAGLVF